MFIIGGTNFEVDKDYRLSYEGGKLNLDVCGDQKVFDTIFEDENHPFNWVLYPPIFYIHDLPLNMDTDINNFEYNITEDDIDEYEIDLYMMEYCTVFPCKVIGRGGDIIVEGMVHDLKKELLPLYIVLKLPNKTLETDLQNISVFR